MTAEGFCELAVLSRYTSGLPCTWRDRIGKSLRMSAAVRTAEFFSSMCCMVVTGTLSEVSILYLISLLITIKTYRGVIYQYVVSQNCDVTCSYSAPAAAEKE